MPKQNFNEKLTTLLKSNQHFLDDTGELIPAAVRDHAWRLDHTLIKLLLTDDEIKATFFDEIDGHWVFNHNIFIDYVTTKNFLANAYTRFRNKIRLNIEGKFLRERGEVSLVWPYKYCELMQYNQTYMDKIRSAQSSEELVALWKDIAENSFLTHYARNFSTQ